MNTSNLFMQRLSELNPTLRSLSFTQLTLTHLIQAFEPASWCWDTILDMKALVSQWRLEPQDVVCVANLGSSSTWSGKIHELLEEAANSALFDGQDLVVLSLERAFVGLFDAQYCHVAMDIEIPVPNPLHFYSVVDTYGEFSNFAAYPVRLCGKIWPTTEHFFQAQKFVGTPHEEKIRKANTPMEAARMGRERTRPLRRDWDTVRIEIMREALIAKFTQHADLRSLLLSTHPVKLVERTENDKFWGDGGNGKGQNWLGRLLMNLRDTWIEEASSH